ncbi:MAG: hypothetical protein R2697_00075 [Ilumatobacteraceae bacterium]
MEITGVVERVERIAATRADDTADLAGVEAALKDVAALQSWLAGNKAALTSRMAELVPFPEKAIADCTRESSRDTAKERERSSTLDAAPSLADALDDARVTPGHVDEFTKATKQLEGEQRDELIDRLDTNGLLDVAAVASVEDWRRRLALEIKTIRADDWRRPPRTTPRRPSPHLDRQRRDVEHHRPIRPRHRHPLAAKSSTPPSTHCSPNGPPTPARAT